jgi:hypothetical protein
MRLALLAFVTCTPIRDGLRARVVCGVNGVCGATNTNECSFGAAGSRP